MMGGKMMLRYGGNLGAFIEASDERADVVQAVGDAVELIGKRFVRVIDSIAQVGEVFFFEILEFAFREELGFERGFAHELFAEGEDGKGRCRTYQPRAEGVGGWRRKFGQGGRSSKGQVPSSK